MEFVEQRTFRDAQVLVVRQAAGRSTPSAHVPTAAPGLAGEAAAAGRLWPSWARTAADAYGLIGLPAAVLCRSHRLAAMNDLMEKLIPHVVQDRPSRVGLADRRADMLLGQSLLRLHGRAGGQVHSIPVAAAPEAPACVVHIVPVRSAANDVFGTPAGVLVITAVARPKIASAQVIQGLFDLTPAEARVARGIATGKTVEELADEAGLADGTIRQQLKSVFSKTGVSRQADLVGILAGSALGYEGPA